MYLLFVEINLLCFSFIGLQNFPQSKMIYNYKLEKKYAPALDNYGQSCFVTSDCLKMKCVYKTQMMPPPDHQYPVD